MSFKAPVRDPVAVTAATWPVVIGAGSALGLLTVAVALPGSGVSTFLVRIAELALAGAAAYLIDDAATAVTVATPRTVWRRRAPRLAWGLGMIGVGWAIILLLLRWQDSPLAGVWLTVEVAVLCCLALSGAALLARHGDSEPGGQAAPAVLLVGLAVVICEPLLDVAILVPDGGPDDLLRRLSWLAVGALSALVLVVASRDPAGSRT